MPGKRDDDEFVKGSRSIALIPSAPRSRSRKLNSSQIYVSARASGGPAIDDQGRVFGVVSRSGGSCNYPLYGEIAALKDWIIEVAERAAELGNYDVPYWAESGSSVAPPEPPPEDQHSEEGEPTSPAQPDPAAGDPCAAPGDCGENQLCVAPGGDFESPICASICASDNDCGAQMVCDGGSGTCASPPAAIPLSEASCTIADGSASRTRGVGGLAFVVLFGAAYTLRRQRGHWLRRITT